MSAVSRPKSSVSQQCVVECIGGEGLELAEWTGWSTAGQSTGSVRLSVLSAAA